MLLLSDQTTKIYPKCLGLCIENVRTHVIQREIEICFLLAAAFFSFSFYHFGCIFRWNSAFIFDFVKTFVVCATQRSYSMCFV